MTRGALPTVQCYDAAEEAMATTTRRVATEEDLLAMPRDGYKYELVDGEIRMSPTGGRHGAVEAGQRALQRAEEEDAEGHRRHRACGADGVAPEVAEDEGEELQHGQGG